MILLYDWNAFYWTNPTVIGLGAFVNWGAQGQPPTPSITLHLFPLTGIGQ